MDRFMAIALEEARLSWAEGGIPIGSVLVIDGAVVGRGHNQRIQRNSAILHAEMDCIENAGRLKPHEYRKATLYTTLSPCEMCSGAILLYRIPKVVIGDNINFKGPEEYLQKRGVQIKVLNIPECIDMMASFIEHHPDIWAEDIGDQYHLNGSNIPF
ncbi:nucleoside deaminase [Candidatus Micrarchaeota archaeon]|nr:MAG: nucleoside deaminase [Candidatus Micrarchaeota archaeon]